jgi:uncharacterized protein YybS (DUF2232 family)
MLSIARLAMKGPIAASLSAAIYAMLAMVFPPFLIVTGGVVSLSGLRHGDLAGFKVALFAAVGAGAIFLVAMNGGQLGVALLFLLLPLVPMAAVLRKTHNQALALLGAAAGGLVFAVFMRAVIGDVDAYWTARLASFGESVVAQGGRFLAAEESAAVANMMHGTTVVLAMMYFLGSVLIGRYWQSALYNPGGFGEEFRQFRLPKPLLVGAAVVSVFSLFSLNAGTEMGLVEDTLLILMVLFAIQGLATVHHRVKERGLPGGFLVLLYVFIAFVPHVVGIVLAFIGILDNVVDFRKLRQP